jgi:hypothetical protein
VFSSLLHCGFSQPRRSEPLMAPRSPLNCSHSGPIVHRSEGLRNANTFKGVQTVHFNLPVAA